MSRISFKEVKNFLRENDLELLSSNYKNLESPLKIKCSKGHEFSETYKNLRKIPLCPICAETSKISAEEKTSKKQGFRILAIDQATINSGWAVFDGLKLIGHSVYSVNDKLPLEQRISMMNQEMIRLIKKFNPDLVVIEDIQLQDSSNGLKYNNIGIPTFKILANLMGVLSNTLYISGIPHEIVAPSVWRNAVGVKGKYRADKKKSGQLLVKQQYGFLALNDESDAILIGQYAAERNNRIKVQMAFG